MRIKKSKKIKKNYKGGATIRRLMNMLTPTRHHQPEHAIAQHAIAVPLGDAIVPGNVVSANPDFSLINAESITMNSKEDILKYFKTKQFQLKQYKTSLDEKSQKLEQAIKQHREEVKINQAFFYGLGTNVSINVKSIRKMNSALKKAISRLNPISEVNSQTLQFARIVLGAHNKSVNDLNELSRFVSENLKRPDLGDLEKQILKYILTELEKENVDHPLAQLFLSKSKTGNEVHLNNEGEVHLNNEDHRPPGSAF
jgi:hypothetical protein